VFDEFLRLQLLLALRRRRLEESSSGVSHPINVEDLDVEPGALSTPDSTLVRRFLAGHRFTLTSAQRRVLGEIAADMSSPLPMHRLLQGDVGSGKTVVALTALLASIDGGRQGALMAPTEVLAEQHLVSIRRDLENLSIHDGSVLAGSGRSRSNCSRAGFAPRSAPVCWPVSRAGRSTSWSAPTRCSPTT